MKRTLSFILLCVLLLSLCSCGETPGVGDTVTINDIEVTFIGVETVADPAMAPKEGNIFVLCEFEIANDTGKSLGVSTILNFQAYCDDYACDFSLGALTSKGDKSQLDGTIADGKKLRGVVGYEVPADWKNLEIQYTPNIADASKFTFVATSDK